jgi:DsbC/DsbD-like thiol-disulfide interchange protein
MKLTKASWAFLLAVAAPFCLAQSLGPTVTGSAPASAKTGQSLTLKVTISIPEGYHIYGPKDKTGVATSVSFSGPTGYKATVEYPKTTIYDGLGEESQVYFGKVVVPVKVTVPKKAKGKATFKLTVTTQACNDKTCLMPETKTLSLSTVVK